MHRLFLALVLISFPFIASATEAEVQHVSESAQIEQLLNSAVSRATTELEGRGTTLELTYSTPEPLSVIILYTNSKGLFDPLDSLVATLPAGTRQNMEVDLSQSLGWSPFHTNYRLHFMSTSSEGATFEKIDFTGASPLNLISASVAQTFSPLPFTPSSYHRLESYNLFGIPLVPFVGVLMVVVVSVLLYRKKPEKALLVAVLFTLLMNARYSLDAMNFALRHSGAWITSRTYATAGDLPEVINDLQYYQVDGVTLCHSGTSFAERFLTYHVYPIPVNTEFSSHVIVHKSTDWSFEDGVLHCGNEKLTAKKIQTYSGGSILFRIFDS